MVAQVIQRNLFAIQLCIPGDWTDEQAIAFVEEEDPCGTSSGWSVRGSSSQGEERVSCVERRDHIHLVVEA